MRHSARDRRRFALDGGGDSGRPKCALRSPEGGWARPGRMRMAMPISYTGGMARVADATLHQSGVPSNCALSTLPTNGQTLPFA